MKTVSEVSKELGFAVGVDKYIEICERDIAREALKFEKDMDLCVLIPVLHDVADDLATLAFSEAGQQWLDLVGQSQDEWINQHPIIRYMADRVRNACMDIDYSLRRTTAIVEKLAQVAA